MTLPDQIESARRALDELTADEAELTRLHANQAEGIQALKDGASKDFALLATLEGKRAALSTMLQEQRAHIAQAQARVAGLEAEKLKGEQLVTLRGRVRDLQARRQETDAALIQLGEVLAAQLAGVVAARVAWGTELMAARGEVQKVYGLASYGQRSNSEGADRAAYALWKLAWAEIGEGAAEALTESPHAYTYRRPQAALGSAREGNALDAARHTFLFFLDRPVMLTIAEAVAAADHAAPHEFSGGDR